MAKNITIAEGGVGRNFGPTKKLETDLQGGGTQYWIPEDEANDYATKTPLTITENGEYTPAEGGFNPVNVNIPLKVDHIEIIEDGTYKASDRGLDGFDRVAVAVPDVTAVTTGSFSENGTYSPAGYGGYSAVTVSVPSPAEVSDGVIVVDMGGGQAEIGADGSMSYGGVVVQPDGTVEVGS